VHFFGNGVLHGAQGNVNANSVGLSLNRLIPRVQLQR
jgi:hypothetical protein